MSKKAPWEAAIDVEPKTDSERYLSKLACKAFLNPWCYGNVHTDEGKKSVSWDGKKLCGLFVVFGDHILSFSDKHCEYPTHSALWSLGAVVQAGDSRLGDTAGWR